jgi:hypothetical protein
MARSFIALAVLALGLTLLAGPLPCVRGDALADAQARIAAAQKQAGQQGACARTPPHPAGRPAAHARALLRRLAARKHRCSAPSTRSACHACLLGCAFSRCAAVVAVQGLP